MVLDSSTRSVWRLGFQDIDWVFTYYRILIFTGIGCCYVVFQDFSKKPLATIRSQDKTRRFLVEILNRIFQSILDA